MCSCGYPLFVLIRRSFVHVYNDLQKPFRKRDLAVNNALIRIFRYMSEDAVIFTIPTRKRAVTVDFE